MKILIFFLNSQTNLGNWYAILQYLFWNYVLLYHEDLDVLYPNKISLYKSELYKPKICMKQYGVIITSSKYVFFITQNITTNLGNTCHTLKYACFLLPQTFPHTLPHRGQSSAGQINCTCLSDSYCTISHALHLKCSCLML